ERKSLGLFPDMTVQDNVIAANLGNAVTGKFYSPRKAHQLAVGAREKLRIASTSVKQKVINLSGGNQQKVVLAKWLLTDPDLFIVDEPTHGIDVGAKQEIYEILKSLAQEGKSILIISSDLPELIGLCDRILVIKKGLLAGDLSRTEFLEEKIMSLGAN
ncbi:MAG: sugar ABC transporter ATP-binding protein, partial [Marivirga sp.]|nr:sugar ABC transporter ATP-binding protein [Marivirga sp.]